MTALYNVTYTLGEGEIKGIIGPNGAGKTTLFNVITGELKPTSGKVLLKGEDITDLSPHSICQKGLGRTFQLTFVFPEMKYQFFANLRNTLSTSDFMYMVKIPWHPGIDNSFLEHE